MCLRDRGCGRHILLKGSGWYLLHNKKEDTPRRVQCRTSGCADSAGRGALISITSTNSARAKTMRNICIPPRAPGGIPGFSAVVPVSSQGLTAGTCTGSHFLPHPSAILRREEETTSWRLPRKAEIALAKMATRRESVHVRRVPHMRCVMRATAVRACACVVTLYTLRSVRYRK